MTDENKTEAEGVAEARQLSSHEVQHRIQLELNVPKGQINEFGGYKYRSLEDINQAVKPLLEKYRATLEFDDKIVTVEDRFYVESTAVLQAIGCTKPRKSKALAREALERKKSDPAQVSGASSSYARKYAAGGLLLCDDSADDPDHQHNRPGFNAVPPVQQQQQQVDRTTGEVPNWTPPAQQPVDQGGPTRQEFEGIAASIMRSVNGSTSVASLEQFYWDSKTSIDALPQDIQARVMTEFGTKKNNLQQLGAA